MLIVLILLILIILSIIGYLLYTAYAPKNKVVQNRLKNIGQSQSHGASVTNYWQEHLESKSFKERMLKPMADKLAAEIAKFTPASMYKAAEKEVEASGNFQNRGMTGFLIYELVMTVGMLGLAIFYVSTRTISTAKATLLIVGAGTFGFAFPIIVIKSMVAERHEAIRRAMPDVLDLLCVSVQAGMGFDGAMGKVTAKMKGPLIDECDRLLQELRMGVTRRNALLRLSERCGIKEMQLFAAALIQAEKLGVGLAQVLEIQSENMREMRRQRAREIAAKMPTKILFPLLIFIFPVIFVVALGPPLVTIVKAFAHG